MRYFITVLIILHAFLIGCSQSSNNENYIDYGTLPEIEVTVHSEINESEHFIPGRLRDLIVTNDGSLIVSDWGSMLIVQFGSDGSFERILAEEGQGPGELQTFFSLIDSKRDTLLIKFSGMSGQIDVFVRDETERSFFYDYSLTTEIAKNRRVNVTEPAPGFGYFAKFEDLDQISRNEIFDPPAHRFETLGIIDISGEILMDSLHVLQIPNTVYIEAESGAVTPLGAPPFLGRDYQKSLANDEYFIAKPLDGTIQVFDQNHDIRDEIILHVQERPVLNSDLNNELKNIPEQFQQKLRERVPATKPVFIDVWASKENFLLHTDNSEQGKEMVLLTRNGEPVGKFFF